jgi:catabolite regulation protein CreA
MKPLENHPTIVPMQFRDPVVQRVCTKFVNRSDVGYKKYGVTLEDDPSEMLVWLNHLQEELMDAVLYLQKAKEKYEAQSSEE